MYLDRYISHSKLMQLPRPIRDKAGTVLCKILLHITIYIGLEMKNISINHRPILLFLLHRLGKNISMPSQEIIFRK